MPIVNSQTGEVRVDYSLQELQEKVLEMRAWNMIALTAAGSGHSGGTLSIMDIAAVLYLKYARHDPQNPTWRNAIAFFWSTGHKAPAFVCDAGSSGIFR